MALLGLLSLGLTVRSYRWKGRLIVKQNRVWVLLAIPRPLPNFPIPPQLNFLVSPSLT